jgi:hypothetical protein
MDLSNWVLVGTTLFLGIIAILAPVVSEAVKRKVFAPIVTVTFDETSPICHKTFFNISSDPMVQRLEPVFYFRFKVENTGKSKLVQCEAVLEQLWIYNSAGIPQRLPGFNDINLRWSGGSPISVDLSPNRGKYCNVGHIASLIAQRREGYKIDLPGAHDDKLRFMFELLEYPNSQANCLVPGKYAIKILLYSENAQTQELWFEIAWSGNWQEAETDMFRELTMRRIRKISDS